MRYILTIVKNLEMQHHNHALKDFRLLLFFLMCFSPFTTVLAQSTRITTDWEFLNSDLGGIWEAVRPVKLGDPESVPLWKKVSLPHCVNAEDAVDPDVNYYQGPMWYKTQLHIQNPHKNGKTFLHFEGAGQKTEVYVYTTKVASHVGGYDEWDADITDAVRQFLANDSLSKRFKGKIPISVRYDNSRDLEMIPSDLSDFTIYGGLYRYVNLVYYPENYINNIYATPTVDLHSKKASLHTRIELNAKNNLSKAQLTIHLLDPKGKSIKTINSSVSSPNMDIALQLEKPLLWSPNEPNLYKVDISLSYDGKTQQTKSVDVGFKTFKFEDHGPFYLNGKRLLLRGTHRHEDHAGVGAAMTEDMIRQDMLLIKNMGVNFIRLGHYQQSPIVAHLCDSLGILVWEEIPWCRGGLGNQIYQEQGKRMLTNMIHQHYNHPSIIIWGLGNENDWPGDFDTFDKDSIRHYMKVLNDLAHSLDSTRKTAIRRCDFCKDIVDVYSPSIWAGWYRGLYTEYKDITKAEFEKVNHFLHVEWGGDSHAGRNSENPDKSIQSIKATGSADERAGDASLYGGAARVSKDGDWSESYICNLFDWHLKEQETMPWLTGTAQWVFKDFATPVRPDNPVPYVNQKGVVERDFTKKESYYVFQSYWTDKPMVHVFSHNWPIRWGNEGEEKMIKVYSNCPEVELFVNGKSYGIKKRNSQDFPAAGLRWDVALNKGDYRVVAIGKKGATKIADTINFTYQTEKWGKPTKMELKELKKDGQYTILEATVKDQNGIICLDAKDFVRFEMIGKGKLLVNQGTVTGSKKIQLSNGKARIKLKKMGNCAVSVLLEKNNIQVMQSFTE